MSASGWHGKIWLSDKKKAEAIQRSGFLFTANAFFIATRFLRQGAKHEIPQRRRNPVGLGLILIVMYSVVDPQDPEEIFRCLIRVHNIMYEQISGVPENKTGEESKSCLLHQ